MKPELKCRDGVRLLGAYTDGALDTRVRQALDRHVAGCLRCRRFVRSYVEVPRIFRKATAATAPARLRHSLRRLTARLTSARAR